MKSLSFIRNCAYAIVVCLGISCTKNADTSTQGDFALVEGATDLTCGMNVNIFNFKTYTDGIKLGCEGEVKVENQCTDIRYNIENRGTDRYLVPAVNISEGVTAYYDKVRIIAGNEPSKTTKEIVVIIRNPDLSTDAKKIEYSTLQKRFFEVLGKTISPANALGETIGDIFDKNYIKNLDATHKFLQVNTEAQGSFMECNGATSYNSVTKSLAREAGLNLNIPLSNYSLNIGVTGSYKESGRTERSEEYYWAYRNDLKGEGFFRTNLLKDEELTGALTIDLNNILNNPGSKEYKDYPTDTAGTYKFLDIYGPMFFTACQLGGQAARYFVKRKDFSEHSVSYGVAAKVSLDKATDDLTKFLTSQLSSHIVQINAQAKDYARNVVNCTRVDEKRRYYGGDVDAKASNAADSALNWKITEDPAKWVPVSYATQNTVNRMRISNESNPDMHYIYELCYDQNSERCKSLMAALTPDNETGRVPYFVHRGLYDKQKYAKMVVADVTIKYFNDGYSPQKGDEEPIYEQSLGDKVWRIYYPMMQNPNADFHRENKGYACDINCSYFHGSDSGSRMYVYYALDWSSEGDRVGIVDVGVNAESKLKDGEMYRANLNYTDRGIDGDPKNGRFYLYVRYASPSTPLKDKLTGVGLYYTKWDNNNGNCRGKVFASTGGTEWDNASGFSDEQKKAYFNMYWGATVDDESLRFFWEDKDDPYHQGSWVDIKKKPRNHTMNVCYTKKDITRDMTGYDQADIIGKDPKKNNPICPCYKYGVSNELIDEESYMEEERIWMNEEEEDS